MIALNGSQSSLLLLLFLIGIVACNMDDNLLPDTSDLENNGSSANNPADTMSTQPIGSSIRIRIGARTFNATLLDNPTVTALKALLPMNVSMSELNGNEKYYNFPKDLPTNATKPGTIHTGDLILYGSNTLVLFYKTFPTSYSYTRLGRVDNPSGLAAALGAESVTVTFELE